MNFHGFYKCWNGVKPLTYNEIFILHFCNAICALSTLLSPSSCCIFHFINPDPIDTEIWFNSQKVQEDGTCQCEIIELACIQIPTRVIRVYTCLTNYQVVVWVQDAIRSTALRSLHFQASWQQLQMWLSGEAWNLSILTIGAQTLICHGYACTMERRECGFILGF